MAELGIGGLTKHMGLIPHRKRGVRIGLGIIPHPNSKQLRAEAEILRLRSSFV